jgi:hypothetical protein
MLTSLLVSLAICTLTVCGFLVASVATAHWFVVPVWLCGVLIGRDAVDWFRGRVDLYDPVGIIGVIGFHFFFLAPLLHVAWDAWMPYVQPPPDWRPWLGGMAAVNAAGLFLYRVARDRARRSGRGESERGARELDPGRLLFAAGCGMAVSAGLQLWVYAEHGGLLGYVDAFTRSVGLPESQSAFAGMGWIFMLSESFPILALLAFAAVARRARLGRAWVVILVVLIGYFVLKLLFGGLRGSRSNTIWGVFWAVGIIHLWIRPVGRRFVVAGMCALLAFMYAYGFYKDLGRDVVALYEGGALDEGGGRLDRTFESLVLGDLGRADVQAFLLYRLSQSDRDYVYAKGRTYLGTAALLVPRRLWPQRPPTKVQEGTEAQFGVGSYDEETWSSSKVYGLAGEAMLNFGPFAVLAAYLGFGVVVGRLQRFGGRLRPGDARLLTYPFLVNLCFAALLGDSDNLLFMFVKDGLVPLFVVWFGSHRAGVLEPSPVEPMAVPAVYREPA